MKKHSNTKILLAYDVTAPDYLELTECLSIFDVVHTGSFHGMLRTIRRQHCDLVLTAPMVKGNDICPFLDELRLDFPGIPLMLVADQIPEPQNTNLINLGVSRVVNRPIDSEGLRSAVLACSNRHRTKFARNKSANYRMENHYSAVLSNSEATIVSFLDTADNLMELVYPAEYGNFPEFKLALYEALWNASQHGCQGPDEEIKVTAHFYHDRIIYEVQDPGEGFDHRTVIAKQANSDKRYGLRMIQSLSDDVSFNGKGNVISLMKLVSPLTSQDSTSTSNPEQA